MPESATLKVLRAEDDAHSAIVFIHGFLGDPTVTWGHFPDFLISEPALAGWDIYSLGYSTKLAPDFKGIWTGNPSIQAVADYFYAQAFVGKLDRYKPLVLIAHSMGGLVVQRALLDRPDLVGRVTHVFFFGTPSLGLEKAGWFKWLKRQVDDLAKDGDFVPRLRADWEAAWPGEPPFHLWAIAGERDEFVPASTALGPFPRSQCLVVPGNHLEIVKPGDCEALAVRAVVRGIQGDAAPAGPWNAASVALEMLDFRAAVATLEPHAAELDDTHLVRLALALEGLGMDGRALEVLEQAGKRGTDARGVLGGRLKRRWITEGRDADYQRALELYSSSFDEAGADGDHAQAFYHGINVCFLLAARPGNRARINEVARAVLDHCDEAPADFWCLGTRGEARLHLDETELALSAYSEAVASKPPPQPWQVQSMHSQACQLAAIINRDELTGDFDRIFRQE